MLKRKLNSTYFIACHDGEYRTSGRMDICQLGAAVIIKDHLSFSILVIFLFSFVTLLFAVFLSWENKENVIFFLILSFVFTFLGSILCTSKKLSFTDFVKLLALVKNK